LGSPLGRTLCSLRGRGARALLCGDGVACELSRVVRVSGSLVGTIAFCTQLGQARIERLPLGNELVVLLVVSLISLIGLARFGQTRGTSAPARAW